MKPLFSFYQPAEEAQVQHQKTHQNPFHPAEAPDDPQSHKYNVRSIRTLSTRRRPLINLKATPCMRARARTTPQFLLCRVCSGMPSENLDLPWGRRTEKNPAAGVIIRILQGLSSRPSNIQKNASALTKNAYWDMHQQNNNCVCHVEISEVKTHTVLQSWQQLDASHWRQAAGHSRQPDHGGCLSFTRMRPTKVLSVCNQMDHLR